MRSGESSCPSTGSGSAAGPLGRLPAAFLGGLLLFIAGMTGPLALRLVFMLREKPSCTLFLVAGSSSLLMMTCQSWGPVRMASSSPLLSPAARTNFATG